MKKIKITLEISERAFKGLQDSVDSCNRSMASICSDIPMMKYTLEEFINEVIENVGTHGYYD